MRKVISVSLDEGLDALLNESAKLMNVSKSELIKRSVRQYLYLNEAKQIRGKLKKYAEKAGFYSEEDIYRAIS